MKAYAEWGSEKVVIDKIEPTHYVRNFLVRKLIKKYSPRKGIKSICEIGCGTGSLSIELGRRGFKVDASDLDKNAIELADKFNRHFNVKYSSQNILGIKSKKKYDMVIAIEVLEHIPEDTKALSKIEGILREEGLLLITVPIHEKYRREFDNRSGHIRRYVPKDLIEKIKSRGFRMIYARYFNFPLLWMWYFYAYLPYSNKKENKMKSEGAGKKLPVWIKIMNIINKAFLADLIFNSKKYSTNILVIAQKNPQMNVNTEDITVKNIR